MKKNEQPIVTDEKNEDLYEGRNIGWFHFFRELIQNGTWAKMSLSAKALYPVLKSYANDKTGKSWPSYDTQAAMSGLALQSVTKAIKELVDLKIVTAEKTPGKSTVYSLREDIGKVEHPVSGKVDRISTHYIPDQMAEAMKELKAFISTGAEGKIIQINFNVNCGDVITTGVKMEEVHFAPKVDEQKVFENIFAICDGKPSVDN